MALFTSITDRRTDGLDSEISQIAATHLTPPKSSIKIAGELNSMPAPTLELEKTAASPAPSAPMTVEDARAMIARVDAAEASGELTDANMSDFGYVKGEGGVWLLPIPTNILYQL